MKYLAEGTKDELLLIMCIQQLIDFGPDTVDYSLSLLSKAEHQINNNHSDEPQKEFFTNYYKKLKMRCWSYMIPDHPEYLDSSLVVCDYLEKNDTSYFASEASSMRLQIAVFDKSILEEDIHDVINNALNKAPIDTILNSMSTT